MSDPKRPYESLALATCPCCQCVIEDGNMNDCSDCGVVACEDCIQSWDDVIGDLCPTCWKVYAP